MKLQSSNLLEAIIQTKDLLKSQSYKIGNFTIVDRLVEIQPCGEALVIGDLHGDLDSLKLILQKSHFLEKLQKDPDNTLVFLGDYGDRGEKSAETYYIILQLKLAFPNQVVLLRGNHEAPKDLLGEPHDLPYQLRNKFGQDWIQIYEELEQLWARLYNAVYVNNRYLMVHGGISSQIDSLQTIAHAKEDQNEAVLEDLLWSDPSEKNISEISPRGAGILFGKSVTKQVLAKLKAHILIRGHEASDSGYKISQDAKVLTLFSRKGSPYFNSLGAYLQIPLENIFATANELRPYIRQF